MSFPPNRQSGHFSAQYSACTLKRSKTLILERLSHISANAKTLARRRTLRVVVVLNKMVYCRGQDRNCRGLLRADRSAGRITCSTESEG